MYKLFSLHQMNGEREVYLFRPIPLILLICFLEVHEADKQKGPAIVFPVDLYSPHSILECSRMFQQDYHLHFASSSLHYSLALLSYPFHCLL